MDNSKVVFFGGHAYDAEKIAAGDFQHANLDAKLRLEKLLQESNERHDKINLEIEFSDKEKAIRINKELQETLKKASSLKQELAELIVDVYQVNER